MDAKLDRMEGHLGEISDNLGTLMQRQAQMDNNIQWVMRYLPACNSARISKDLYNGTFTR